MAQHDMVIDDGPGLAVRTDINAAVAALVSLSAGPIEPATTFAGMLWLDTSVAPNGQVNMRNQANTGWVAPNFASGQGAVIRRQFITTSGAITLHADTKVFEVEVQGGGGGGGNCNAGAAGAGAAASGGGAGGYASKTIARPAGTYNPACTIGAGGASVSNGGASQFTDGTNTVSGNGGSAGIIGGQAVGWARQGGIGGAGVGGDVNVNGDQGGSGLSFVLSGSATGVAHAGASSKFGAGGPGQVSTTGTSYHQGGNAALGRGAGGAGALVLGAGSAVAGGAGLGGVVVITEYR